MEHHFNVEIAKQYGVDCAVLIHNLYFWLVKNEANGRHYHDGKTWTYNSMKAFAKLCPYWTERQVRYLIDKLKDEGALFVGNYNEDPKDRTQWYALAEEIYEMYDKNVSMHLTKTSDESDKSVAALPDNKPDNKQISSSTARASGLRDEEIAKCTQRYEQNIGTISTTVTEDMAEYIAKGISSELIVAAINEAAVQNKRSWVYVSRILDRCSRENIQTAEAYLTAQAEWRRKKKQKQKGGDFDDWDLGGTRL